MDTTSSSYDALPYGHCAFPQTHPDRLAVLGRLYGLSPAPPDRCRVLELGCALGGNLLPMAACLPGSRFVGIDLSEGQIERGQAVVEQLGLENIELRAQDLMDFDDPGPFDYILCHGVYSWVPQPVRERIWSICKNGLAAGGLATISYNVYPGWHVKEAVRDILRHGARGGGEPGERVARALEFLAFVARNVFKPDSPYGRTVRDAAETLVAADPIYVFHEYLEDFNRPERFEEFVAGAASAGLRYVADASLSDPSNRLTDEARQFLTGASDDLVRCEQTLDFLRRGTFRRAVLCHDGLPVERWPRPAALRDMLLVALAECVSPEPASPDAVEQFRNAAGHTLSTSDAGLKTALRLLARARPRGVSYAELLADVRASRGELDEARWAQLLLACGTTSLVALHVHLPAIASRPGDCPRAGAVARWQAAAGQIVVNLRHECLELDGLSRAVLSMLDGRRGRQDVCDELARRLGRGELTVADEAGQARSPAPSDWPGIVEGVLDALAGLSLLLAGGEG